MNAHEIKLPVKKVGGIDFLFMEKYIKSLPYSSQVESVLTDGKPDQLHKQLILKGLCGCYIIPVFCVFEGKYEG